MTPPPAMMSGRSAAASSRATASTSSASGAGQRQYRQPVDRGEARAGDHVQGAGADRGGDGEGGVPAGRLGVPGRDVHQGLLVAALDERHRVAELVECLAEAGDVAVAEDAQRGRDEPAALTVGNRVLLRQVRDEGLRDGELHVWFSYQGRPGSTTVFSSVISATARRGPSLPMPLPFRPP